MTSRYAFCVALVAALVFPPVVRAQDIVSVDARTTIADVSRRPIGINVNFLVDDDANRKEAIATLADALKRAGVKYLRYPGGEKSDGYLWSIPPFATSVPTLARWATGDWPDNGEWPSYDRSLVQPDGRTFLTDPLDFDEFMAVCRAIDCVPTVVVCYDSMYKGAQPGGVAPSRAQLLETAREWVRYSNVTRGYGVRHWEIGNETWQAHYNGGATAANYANDLVEFSRVMKAVDPTIQIGANGESEEWWSTVLPIAARAIDFLAIHNYPAYEWGSYTHYRDTDVRLDQALDAARHAIANFAPPEHRSRLRIAVTETGPADWSGAWPHRNDTGHALVLFEILGRHLTDPQVEFTQLWNTRWTNNETVASPSLFDALDRRNDLQATGRVLAIWGEFMKPQLVASTSTAMVRTFATASPAAGTLTVFLINKDTKARDVIVRTVGFPSSMSVRKWVFKGTGHDDVHPEWQDRGTSESAGGQVTVTLDPVSITVLDLSSTLQTVAFTVEAANFAEGGQGCWQGPFYCGGGYYDETAGNWGDAQVRPGTDVDLWYDDGGIVIGGLDGLEWLAFRVNVPQSGQYRVTFRTASPIDRPAGSGVINVGIHGVDGSWVGNQHVPVTGGRGEWHNYVSWNPPTPIYLPAGQQTLTMWAAGGWYNVHNMQFTLVR